MAETKMLIILEKKGGGGIFILLKKGKNIHLGCDQKITL